MSTILILEDDTTLALTWQAAFEAAGDKVRLAATATAALEILGREAIDLLVTDIFIVDGGRVTADGGVKLIGLLRAAGAARERRDLPIIAITGQPQDSRYMPPILDLAKSLGADLCVEKPVEPDLLVEMAHRQIARGTDAGAASEPRRSRSGRHEA